MRRLHTLTTRGAIALGIAPVAAVIGLFFGAEELVLLSIGLAMLVLVGLVQSAHRARLARGKWRLGVTLTSTDAEVGSHLELHVTVAAAGGVALPVWLEEPQHSWERVRHGAHAEPEQMRLPNPSSATRVAHPGDGATKRFDFPVSTKSRGVYVLGGLRLWCFDTFALVARRVAVGPSATITVHPAPVGVELGDEYFRGDQGTEDNQPPSLVAPRRVDSFGDFSGLRPYVAGDRLRLLYWPALARTGELMVRDFEDAGPRRVHVVADVRARNGPEGCESVLAMAAGVGLQVLARGSVVELSTTAGERLAIGPGPLGDVALLRAIASLEPGADRAPSRHRWRRSRRRATPRGQSKREFQPVPGRPLVVTTAEGATDLPGSLAFAHLVIAP